MRVFIAIPIPLLILGAIVFSGATDRDPGLRIPSNIESADVDDQVEFGDRARKAKRYGLAIKYCVKGIESEDFNTTLTAQTCMMWAHKANGDIDEALIYAYRYREWEQSQGFDTKYVDDDIRKLEGMK